MSELGVDVWITHRQPDSSKHLIGGYGEKYEAIALSSKAKECFGFLASNLRKEMELKDSCCLPGADNDELYETAASTFCRKIVEFCERHGLTYKVE